jgi:hypothetical protein
MRRKLVSVILVSFCPFRASTLAREKWYGTIVELKISKRVEIKSLELRFKCYSKRKKLLTFC